MKLILSTTLFFKAVVLVMGLSCAMHTSGDEPAATNATPTSASIATIPTENGAQDPEAAEIRRLQAQAQTNLDAGRQWGTLMKKRHQRLLHELQESPDPVS